MRRYKGGCHCGALGIIYRTDIDPMYWRLRHDGCSFCRRHGVVGTSDPAGTLSVDIEDPSKVRHYRFAHRTADFLICGECGVFVAAITDVAQGRRAVINARVLNGVSLDWSSIVDVHFDTESPLQRADRRSLHWTPVVEVSGGIRDSMLARLLARLRSVSAQHFLRESFRSPPAWAASRP